jgi:hypothetical protein
MAIDPLQSQETHEPELLANCVSFHSVCGTGKQIKQSLF